MFKIKNESVSNTKFYGIRHEILWFEFRKNPCKKCQLFISIKSKGNQNYLRFSKREKIVQTKCTILSFIICAILLL